MCNRVKPSETDSDTTPTSHITLMFKHFGSAEHSKRWRCPLASKILCLINYSNVLKQIYFTKFFSQYRLFIESVICKTAIFLMRSLKKPNALLHREKIRFGVVCIRIIAPYFFKTEFYNPW